MEFSSVEKTFISILKSCGCTLGMTMYIMMCLDTKAKMAEMVDEMLQLSELNPVQLYEIASRISSKESMM